MGAMNKQALDNHLRAQGSQNYSELERREAERERTAQKAELFGAMYGNNLDASERAAQALKYGDLTRRLEELGRQIGLAWTGAAGAVRAWDAAFHKALDAHPELGDAMAQLEAEIVALDEAADAMWSERQKKIDEINALYFPSAFVLDVKREAAERQAERMRADRAVDPTAAEEAERRLQDLLP